MMLNVVMRDRFNGLKLGKALEAEQSRIQSKLPAGVTFSRVTDQSAIIKEAVGDSKLKFFVALLVVMIVSLISLGWRVGIVVAAAVPLTLSATLVIMLSTGRDLDRITLGALILSLGLLVDDAIIAIETMVVKLEEGWDRIWAASYAWSHTAAPMLAGTLVTVIGLMPVGFAHQVRGSTAEISSGLCASLCSHRGLSRSSSPRIWSQASSQYCSVRGGYAAIYERPLSKVSSSCSLGSRT